MGVTAASRNRGLDVRLWGALTRCFGRGFAPQVAFLCSRLFIFFFFFFRTQFSEPLSRVLAPAVVGAAFSRLAMQISFSSGTTGPFERSCTASNRITRQCKPVFHPISPALAKRRSCSSACLFSFFRVEISRSQTLPCRLRRGLPREPTLISGTIRGNVVSRTDAHDDVFETVSSGGDPF